MISLNDNWKKNLPEEIKRLEKMEVTTTQEYSLIDEPPLTDYTYYLYHGIRFQKYLEKLESIFQMKKIVSGKYLKNYYYYLDNCNKGEYVSLLNRHTTDYLSYDIFIEENISLLVSPLCNAIETKYVSYSIWEKINKYPLKQIYSYAPGECMCKDYISLEYIRAIGIPYQKLIQTKGQVYTDKLINDLILLMNKYNITMPIVDTSRYNFTLTPSMINNNKDNLHQLTKKLINR